MINATDSFITAVNADSRTFIAKIFKNNVPIDCDLRSITVKKEAFGDTELAVGAVTSAEVEIIADGIADVIENEDIEIRIGVRAGTDGYLLDNAGNRLITANGDAIMRDFTEYIRIGRFTATKVRSTTFETEIKCVGFISSKLNGDYSDPEEDPATRVAWQATLANIAARITELTGIPISFKDGIDSSGVITESREGLTNRDALEAIASVTGGFAAENADGGIEIHKYQISSSLLNVTPDRVIEQPKLADNDYVMSGIAVTGKGGTFSSGADIKQKYSNDFMTALLFTQFAANIVGYTYRPGDVPMSLGDPRLEPWDTLHVTDLDGNTYDVPCHRITLHYDGGITTDITAVGESDSDQTVKTPLMKRIETIEETAAEQASLIEQLEHQIDGKIETWARETDPSAEWTNKEVHLNDLWLYTGIDDITVGGVEIHPQGVYQYVYDVSTQAYSWEAYSSTTDNLFVLADGKATIYYGTYPFTSITGMQENDLAVDSSTKKIYRYSGSAWGEVDNYSSAISALRSDLEEQIDAKIETYYQDLNPAASWLPSEYEAHEGDLWYYTGETTTAFKQDGTYRWNGSTWEECTVAKEVFDAIDGKTTIFYGSPEETYAGVQINDYLVDSKDGSTYRWTGLMWVLETDYMSVISSQVVLEVTYAIVDGIANLNAFVYVAGLPETESFADDLFTWYRKTEDYENYPTGKIPIGTGKRVSVDLAEMDYGGVIRCEFDYQVEAYLLYGDDSRLVTKDGDALIVAA